MTDTLDWKPSPAIVDALVCAADSSKTGYDFYAALAIAVRHLIIAEEQPKIEAAERERVLEMAAEAVERLKPIPKTLAGIAELEALLNEADPSPVIIQSDGKVVPDYAAVIRALKDSKP